MTIRTTAASFSLHPLALALAGILVMGQAVAAQTEANNKKAASSADTKTDGSGYTDSASNKNNTNNSSNTSSDNNSVSVHNHVNNSKVNALGMITVYDQQFSKDEIGYNRVYTRDIVNLYKGKKEIEIYRGNTVSDLFTGMVGIYSGDSRNSGALDPNIRGMQGEGRIPVTVDGTEQSITVWRGYAGVNNRNYVDPNLISSIYVEKGPSLNSDIHSGIGGSVALKTLDVDDIVAKGEKYGMEIKLETGDNSIGARKNIYANSMDYRDLAHPEAAQMGQFRLYFDDSDRIDPRTSGKNHFFNDKAMRIAAATKQDYFDLTAAYAWRNKGNYFSGKRAAEKYGYQPIISLEDLKNIPPLSAYDPYIAQIGLIQLPGREVTNTSLMTESWLLKGALKLPNNQNIKLGYRYTDSHFGDIMPSRIIGPLVDYTGRLNQVVEWPLSWVKQQAVNLDYSWQPENNQWLNLKSSLWTTLNDSKTNSAGGAPGDGIYFDKDFDGKYQIYYYANGNDITVTPEQRAWYQQLNKMINPDNIKPGSADSSLPNTNGRFNTIDGAAYYSKNNRTGFNLSNRMQLTRMLDLTLMGNFQYETLKSTDAYADFFAHPDRYADEIAAGKVNKFFMSDHIGLPRNGKRQESNFAFNFKFTPADWLVVTAGARYSDYSLQDDYVNSFLEADPNHVVRADAGKKYFVPGIVENPIIYEIYKEKREAIAKNEPWPHYLDRLSAKYGKQNTMVALEVFAMDYKLGNEIIKVLVDYQLGKSATWMKDKYGHYDMKDNPFTNGTIDLNAEVINPIDGKKVKKYYAPNYLTNRTIREPLDDSQKANLHKQTGHGWAPLASLTAFFTAHSRAYVRYSESLRYPSLFEGTIGFSNAHATNGSYGRLGYLWKPEHAKNWEVGYVYSFAHLLPRVRYADFRVNYYHNTTENIIDRDIDYNFYQYDKQRLSGVEMQGRFDAGRLFADLGVVRTIKDEVCDRATAFIEGSHVGYFSGDYRAPDCQNGGMSANGYLANMIPPRWSVVANLGSRFFNEQLEIGTRFTYYSRVYDTRYKSFEGAGFPSDAYVDAALRWQPVAIYDAYVRYKLNKNLIAELTGNNLSNLYYLDPMSHSYVPAPGRTVRMSVTGRF